MDAFGVVLTVIVLVGVAVFILLFERKRATRIERDLRNMADESAEEPGPKAGEKSSRQRRDSTDQ